MFGYFPILFFSNAVNKVRIPEIHGPLVDNTSSGINSSPNLPLSLPQAALGENLHPPSLLFGNSCSQMFFKIGIV